MITPERERIVKERAVEAKQTAQAAYEAARQRFLAEIDGEAPAERTRRKAAAHQDMILAERRQQVAYQRELTGRMMVQSDVSAIVQAVDQFGGASAWQRAKDYGYENDVGYELPDHVLEAMKPFADADMLPRPDTKAVDLIRSMITNDGIAEARVLMAKYADRYNFNDLHVEVEQQARTMRRAASREQHRTSFVDHRRMSPGERLHVDVQADTVERQGTQAPVTAPQTPVHTAETPNQRSDTSAPQNAVQRAPEGDSDGETARIITLAQHGMSRRRICRELYGASGGRAYRTVQSVLDAAGL